MDKEDLRMMLAIGNHFMTMVSETTQGVNLQKNLESCKIAIKNVDGFIAQNEKGSKDYKAWVDVRKNYHWVMDRILEKMP